MTRYPIVAEVSVQGLDSLQALDATVQSLARSSEGFNKTWRKTSSGLGRAAKNIKATVTALQGLDGASGGIKALVGLSGALAGLADIKGLRAAGNAVGRIGKRADTAAGGVSAFSTALIKFNATLSKTASKAADLVASLKQLPPMWRKLIKAMQPVEKRAPKALKETTVEVKQLDGGLLALNETADEFSARWGKMSPQLEITAKRLDKATGGFDKLRQQVDQTVDPLRLFGKAGIDVANAIDDISDPALRAKTAVKLLDAQMAKQRSTVNKLGDRFKVVRAEAILFVGSEQRLMAITRAATTTFAAFGAGITALVGGAFAAGIKANKRYTKGVKDLKHNLTVTLATFGQIALQVLRFEEVIGTANKALNKFNKDTAKNADVIGKKMKTLFSAVLTGIRAIGNAFLGIKLIFQGVGVAIGTLLASIPNQIEFMLTLVHVILAKMAKAIKDMLIEIGVPENLIPMKNIEKRLEGITRKLRGIGLSGAKAREMLGAGFKDGAKDIATFNNAIDTMQQKLGNASGGALDFGGLGGGGGKKDDFDPKQKTIGLAGLAQFATLREAMRGAAKGAMDVDFARTVGKSDINRDMEKLIKTARQAAASLGTVARSQRELAQTFGISIPDVVRYVQMMTDLKEQMGSTFKDSIVETTGALTGFFGAFAAGESSLSAFGDAMADLAGNIAGTFGQLFVKMGVGMVLVNPAVGAGLIAAGVGLNVLGGAISSKGSANSGGGGGGRGSRASATSTVNRELARSLRAPERRGGRNETLVLQIGEEQIAATVRRVVNGQMRLNRIGRRSL